MGKRRSFFGLLPRGLPFGDVLKKWIKAVVIIDGKNEVVFFNRAAESLWGCAVD